VTIPSLPTKPPTQLQPPTTPSTSSQYNSPSPIPIPRTTLFNQRKRKERDEAPNNGSKRKYERKQCFNVCKHCKLPKTKDFGHCMHVGQYSVDTFCPAVEGKQYPNRDAWMNARKEVNPPKPKNSYIKNSEIYKKILASLLVIMARTTTRFCSYISRKLNHIFHFRSI
jgi:hypothetical protein